ncbi:MAG: large conductance mechanosensitive channel protein MscL [Anaerolineae bacterium]|jgi:large conductance mechanosensitive channel|nr:large conductance mechanosensitive channel protein MscL [Anaerolineae bacterium]
MLKEFRDFIMRGNVLDLAVGIIIGAAFGAIVTSLVNDIIMPPIGVILGGVDFSNIYTVLREGSTPGPYASLAAAKEAGAAVIAWGVFVNALINFLVVALAVFLLVKSVNRMMELRKKEEKAVEAAKPDPQEKLIAAMDRLTATLEKKV